MAWFMALIVLILDERTERLCALFAGTRLSLGSFTGTCNEALFL